MNFQAVKAIYFFEMARFFRTLLQSFVSPVISTSLYFVVFGTAIGSRIQEVEGISYGAFIVPGLIMLSVMTQATSNGSFGIYFPKFIGTIYELLSAPISYFEIILGYVGAAATKALFIGLVILATAAIFVDLKILHPVAMILFLVLTCKDEEEAQKISRALDPKIDFQYSYIEPPLKDNDNPELT